MWDTAGLELESCIGLDVNVGACLHLYEDKRFGSDICVSLRPQHPHMELMKLYTEDVPRPILVTAVNVELFEGSKMLFKEKTDFG